MRRRLWPACWLGGLAIACGPFFPNRFLDSGDRALLEAPRVDFASEIHRLGIVTSLRARGPGDGRGFVEDATAVELADLSRAVEGRSDAAALVRDHGEARGRMIELERALVREPEGADRETRAGRHRQALRVLEPVPGLPREFALYFKGAALWHAGDGEQAVGAWASILELPPEERRFKTTWAAYMLGRAALGTDPTAAREWFRKVRQWAAEGWPDSMALAVDSIGWEAKTYFDRGPLIDAVPLYLRQWAAGDASAVESLRRVALKACSDADAAALRPFASDPAARRIVSAHLMSIDSLGGDVNEGSGERDARRRWLDALEMEGVRDVEGAELFGWVAYQAGEFERARRWTERGKATPARDWLRVKLLLREGNAAGATRLLSRLQRHFPMEAAVASGAGLAGSLRGNSVESIDGWVTDPDPSSAGRQIAGELATLKLARRDYVEALDLFLKADFWDDAAWIAERVLRVEELRDYVRRRWPEPPAVGAERPEPDDAPAARRRQLALGLRHLLGRRLVRIGRFAEASSFLPESLRGPLRAYQEALERGHDRRRPAGLRARDLMIAARIARRDGLELLGTELAPDYVIHGGQYEEGISPDSRSNRVAPGDGEVPGVLAVPMLNRPSDDERRRSGPPPALPGLRFHYRYLAADLAWEASLLLPDQCDETAAVLVEGGSWLKARDPQSADRFYKALVRRCRKTALGKAADDRRWFPPMDDKGRLIRDEPVLPGGVPPVHPPGPEAPAALNPPG